VSHDICLLRYEDGGQYLRNVL